MKSGWLAGIGLMALTACAQPSGVETGAPTTAAAIDTPERRAASQEVKAAIGRKDPRQAIALIEDWTRRHPTDVEFRRFEPLLHRLAGDRAGWERSRASILRSWQENRGSLPRPEVPGIVIDAFDVPQGSVMALQCFERAGPFGVLYELVVFGPKGQVTSYFTVESTEWDNEIGRTLGKTAPTFTLDHFVPGRHETVGFLDGLPPYDEIRRRAVAYLADPNPVSASSYGRPVLPSVHCETGGTPPRT